MNAKYETAVISIEWFYRKYETGEHLVNGKTVDMKIVQSNDWKCSKYKTAAVTHNAG